MILILRCLLPYVSCEEINRCFAGSQLVVYWQAKKEHAKVNIARISNTKGNDRSIRVFLNLNPIVCVLICFIPSWRKCIHSIPYLSSVAWNCIILYPINSAFDYSFNAFSFLLLVFLLPLNEPLPVSFQFVYLYRSMNKGASEKNVWGEVKKSAKRNTMKYRIR